MTLTLPPLMYAETRGGRVSSPLVDKFIFLLSSDTILSPSMSRTKLVPSASRNVML